ncbi:hypothetical protein Tco_1406881 [Tanacetum coccineum]
MELTTMTSFDTSDNKIRIKVTNDKDCSLMIGVFRLKMILMNLNILEEVYLGITSYGYCLKIVSSGWSLVPAVLGYVDGFLQRLRFRGSNISFNASSYSWNLLMLSVMNHQLKFSVFAKGVPVGPVFLLGLLALAIGAACAFRAKEMCDNPSISGRYFILEY